MSRSPIDPVSSREEQASLFTAFALGQLSGAEREAVQASLAGPDASLARQQVDETSRLAEALASGRSSELPERSTELRRAVLAAAAQADAAITPAARPLKKSHWRRRVAEAGVVVATLCVLMALLLPPVQNARETARRSLDSSWRYRDSSDYAMSPSFADPHSDPHAARRRSLSPELRRSVDIGGQSEPGQTQVDHTIMYPSEGRWSELTKTRMKYEDEAPDRIAASGERYNRFIENGFLAPTEHPLSTFSIDVDTASYANVRRFLMAGQKPPHDAVRIEEFVNYFRYDDPGPKSDVPFSVNVEAAPCPWRGDHKIVRVGLAGRDVARDQHPAGNLVFLVDVSGSMADDNKLPLVKQALTMLVDELTENDRVAIVTYAGNAGLKLPSTSGDQKQKIRDAIQSLSSGGSTHGSAGIKLAYEQAAERFIQGGANRVILATDGDLNVGVTSDEALAELITRMAKGGTFLTVLGFGQGNLQDEKMEKLADKGNGVYAYIDSVREARKVLVEQLTGSTITIAKDVKIQVEFNPARVASYRLLGYENRALADRDFRDDTKDAGEIGAGHGVTALYEIALVGDDAPNTTGGAEPLKYQPQPKRESAPVARVTDETSRELLTVKLRYKKPDGDTSRLLEVPLADTGARFEDASTNLRFASAVAAFAMILRGSEHSGGSTLPMVAEIAAGALGPDEGGYRAEFLDLVRRAQQMQ